ncbi:hypothetical protein DV735_g5151, partial [Chaetothyriales sp. CBS 134920]
MPVPAFSAPGNQALDPAAIAMLKYFNMAMLAGDVDAVAHFFLQDGYWRDHLALSVDFHTLKGRNKIQSFLREHGLWLETMEIDMSSDYRMPRVVSFDGLGKVNGIEAFIKFASKHGVGRGIISLFHDSASSSWKISSLFTSLDSLTGPVERPFGKRVVGVPRGGHPGSKNWLERRTAESKFADGVKPAVLIVGAGQTGLTAAARLKLLGVDSLIIDQNPRIGHNWRNLNHHPVLHDPDLHFAYLDHHLVLHDHDPHFAHHWPIFTLEDKVAEWFDIYAPPLDLNVWTQTTITKSSWDQSKAEWTVTVERVQADGSKDSRTLHPKHIIQTTGCSGKKSFLQIPGIEDLKGDPLCHSAAFSGATANHQGKKAVVGGCYNSGHDISPTLYENGDDVSMMQRSSLSAESTSQTGLKGIVSNKDGHGPPLQASNIWAHGTATSVLKLIQRYLTTLQNKHDEEILDGVTNAGFKLDQGTITINKRHENDRALPHSRLHGADETAFATSCHQQAMRAEAANISSDDLAHHLSTLASTRRASCVPSGVTRATQACGSWSAIALSVAIITIACFPCVSKLISSRVCIECKSS